MRLIDADALCEGLVSNHPVAIAARCAPTIEAAPVVHASWLGEKWNYTCSNCGDTSPEDGGYKSKYCTGCGAKMTNCHNYSYCR